MTYGKIDSMYLRKGAKITSLTSRNKGLLWVTLLSVLILILVVWVWVQDELPWFASGLGGLPQVSCEVHQTSRNPDEGDGGTYYPPFWILKKVIVPALLLIGAFELQLAAYGYIDRRRRICGYGLLGIGFLLSFLSPYLFFFGW